MKLSSPLLLITLLMIIGCSTGEQPTVTEEIPPPDAEKIPKELTSLGDTRVDEYYWMKLTEDQRQSANPDDQTQKVVDYLDAENNYREKVLQSQALEDELYDELVGRIKQDDSSVPYFNNGYYYYTRFEEGYDYPIYCRKKDNLNAEEEILLNANEMGQQYDFFSMGSMKVSPNNKIIAYSIDTVGRRKYVGYFKNLETGELYPDQLPLFGSGEWAADNKTFVYSTIDNSTLRDYLVHAHVLGTDPAEDPILYEETDNTYAVFLYKAKSGKYIMLGAGKSGSADVKVLPAQAPLSGFKEIYPRTNGIEYQVYHYGNDFYILTNEDALNFALYKTPESNLDKSAWKEVIPHNEEILLEYVEFFNNHMVIGQRIKGLTAMNVINMDSGEEHLIDFGEEAYVAYVGTNPEFNSDSIRLQYSSMTTPWTVMDYNMNTRESVIKKVQPVLGGFDSDNYVTKRIWAEARDGVQVPISLVYRKDLELNRENPMLVYGYGSYGASMEPWFNADVISLLDRGWVWATAHIRGGSELGRKWYESGRMYNKKNTFADFIDCTEYLVREGYADPDNVHAMGGSAGGLLMGAVVNMRPDLYNSVVAAVPFVDIITTMLDESIPLTTFEYEEWGNPSELEEYEYMKSYSPYDNVREAEYPNMLVTTGFHDSQVQFWEPAKWVAKLRDNNQGDNKIFLYTDMESGHGGASGRLKGLQDNARVYAFLITASDWSQEESTIQ